jgi:hypothetical protein
MLPLLVSRSEIMQLKSPNTIYLSVLLLILLQYLICLQECCHMDTNLVEYLEKNNNYKFYISQGDTNTKGVVIIVNKNY